MRAAIFVVFGLVFGSFLTVVIHRVPRKESIVAPGSRCPTCGYELKAADNIPVVSYLLLRGRCRRCRTRISPEYPLTEAATAGLFVLASLRIAPTYPAAVVALFLAALLAVAVIDARERVIPNRITYVAVPLFLLLIAVGDLGLGQLDVLRGLAGLALYAVPLFLVALIAPGGMGMGDVKLAALIGLVAGSFGLARVAVAAGLGVLTGGVGAIVAMAAFGYGRKQHLPFGPFLAVGGAVAVLWGGPIADAYLNLL
jgi:leader peptidase (prepilin peptidase)/N-methyltransferase